MSRFSDAAARFINGGPPAVPPALRLARLARLARRPIGVAPPHELWELCRKEHPRDSRARGSLYTHAMEEAGHLRPIPAHGPMPGRDAPCTTCGWEPPAVTAAIVEYNTPLLARNCLDSIDGEPWLTRATIVPTGGDGPNIGYSAALDAVFSNAETPLVLALNADVEFPDEDLGWLVDIFNANPLLGVLGVRQRDPRGWITHAGVEEPGSPSGGREYGKLDVGQCCEPYLPIAQVSGSAMFIRRRALEAVGGFTRMPTLYYEDALLCHRMRRGGWEVGYTGATTLIHRVASSPSQDRAELAAEGRRAWFDELAAEVPPVDLHLENVRRPR